MALINFSLPIIPSFSSTEPNKLVETKLFDGSVTQQLLFLPDIKVIINFAKGNLGIADGLAKKMILSNISQIDEPKVLDEFLKYSGGKLSKPAESYFEEVDNETLPKKPKINPADISLDKLPGNLGGLGALEKSMMQSMFETQKPYMDIIKLVLENLVKIEDIIARVLALSGSSMNPKNNPRALGFQGNKEFNDKMSQLDGLIKTPSGPAPDNKNNTTPDQNTEDPRTKGGIFVTQSIVYSTGEFDPNVDYTYIYEFAKEQEFNLNGTFSVPPLTGDEHLPKYVVFAVLDSNLEPIQESLITTPLQESKLDGTISKNINWLNRSGKWFGNFDQIKDTNGDFTYVRDVFGNIAKYGEEGPSIEVGPDNNKEKKFIKKGFPRITGLSNLTNYYNQYYLDETRRRAQKKGLSASQIDGVVAEIGSKLATPDNFGTSGIQTTVEAALQNGFLNVTNNINTTGLNSIANKLINIKFPFKPKKVTHKGEEVWIDPESKYEMKIIKCDSSLDITFLDIESDNKKFKTTKIIRFVRDSLSIKLSDNSQFYYEITEPRNLPIPNNGVTAEISIDNTLGNNLGSQFQPPVSGNLKIYSKIMPNRYSNGAIFTSPEDGRHFRLFRFNNGWKIEEIYWTISNERREGDIVSLSVYGGVKKETGLDGVQRVVIKFPDNNFYYFTTFDGQFLHKKIYESSLSSLRPQDINQLVQVTINSGTGTSTTTSSIIPPNAIRVQDPRYKFGRLISNTQVLNEKLADKNKLFSRGPYGSPTNGNKQKVEQIYRFQQTEDDTETYYIIEGVLSSENKQKLGVTQNSTGGGSNNGSGDYSFPDFIGVIPIFIEMLIDVFAKLIPTITSFINLISNPAKFLTDIITAKIGDNKGTEPEKFGIFSKKFFDDLTKLSSKVSNISPTAENTVNIEQSVQEMEDFIQKSKLNNYVYITPSGLPKFLLDGIATIKLFGDSPLLQKLPSITFGIETKLSNLASGGLNVPPLKFDFGEVKNKSSELFSKLTGVSSTLGQSVNIPKPKIPSIDSITNTNLTNPLGNISVVSPIRLIFEFSSPASDKTLNELSGLTDKGKLKTPSILHNSNFDPVLEIPNELETKIDDNNFLYQIVDIQYSTGQKIENIDYQYVYVYRDVQERILEAQRLDDAGETNQALGILEEVAKQEPNNGLIKDLLDELKNKSESEVQPIIKFLLELVSLPLKVVFGIISYIMDVFKSLLNPFEMPFTIINFVSFKWMLDFFNPTSKNSIFQILGMKFDIESFLTIFIPGFLSGTKQSFDMSKIISMPFFAGKLPTYDRDEFDTFFNLRNGTIPGVSPLSPTLPKLPSIPTQLLSNILCLIESIINAIIDFIWSLLGLGSIIPAPHLKLCRDSNQNPNANDIADLIAGKFKDPSKDDASYNFVFNVKTSDGRDVRGLDRDELNKWLEENKDLQIDFNI